MDDSVLRGGPTIPQTKRSVTLPIRPSTPSRRSSSSSGHDSKVLTLYTHPSARVVAFATGPSSFLSTKTRSPSASQEETGTLPWTSRFERTLAAGSLHLYRAPGSVAFISCRDALQPILPKSQCWCVDDDSSKFVLQIRRPQYWRIELPNKTKEEQRMLQEFKDVLTTVLQFEKTACPFQRTFTIELPKAPETPLKKKPWKPVGKLATEAADSRHATGEHLEGPDLNIHDTQPDIGVGGYNIEDSSSRSRSRSPDSPPFITSANVVENYDALSRSNDLRVLKSRTSPPQPAPLKIPSSKEVEQALPSMRRTSIRSNDSAKSSVESFHSVQSWHSSSSPLPPSPPNSTPSSPIMNVSDGSYQAPSSHSRDSSEITVTPSTPRFWEVSASPFADGGGGPSDGGDAFSASFSRVSRGSEDLDGSHALATRTTDRPAIRHRATTSSNSRRRALSPLPPAANIFSPPRQRFRRAQTARHLPIAIIQKTCEILLSPPSHLLSLMLNIASKIAAGEWRGIVFGFGERGESIPVQWDYTDGDYYADDWTEDDYGMSLVRKNGRVEPAHEETSCEVD